MRSERVKEGPLALHRGREDESDDRRVREQEMKKEKGRWSSLDAPRVTESNTTYSSRSLLCPSPLGTPYDKNGKQAP